MKNLTDFRKTVETGMGPRLVFKALLPGRMWGDRLGKTEKYLQIIDLKKNTIYLCFILLKKPFSY